MEITSCNLYCYVEQINLYAHMQIMLGPGKNSDHGRSFKGHQFSRPFYKGSLKHQGYYTLKQNKSSLPMAPRKLVGAPKAIGLSCLWLLWGLDHGKHSVNHQFYYPSWFCKIYQNSLFILKDRNIKYMIMKSVPIIVPTGGIDGNNYCVELHWLKLSQVCHQKSV